MNNALAIILQRRAAIEREMQECRDRLQVLQAEIPELAVAERVLTRLTGSQTEAAPKEEAIDHEHDISVTNKPVGIPTMPEMILEALRSGQAIPLGMEPRDIMKFIADRWWPDVRSELVGPIAWRMWKRGDLVKDGPLYKLPTKNEATDNEPDKGSSVASETGLFE
jgi:hypothetical protein